MNPTHITVFPSPLGTGETSPIASEKIIHGTPVQTVWSHYTSTAGTFFAGQWACTAGAWRVCYGPQEQEYCQILEGEVLLTHTDGTVQRFCAGDEFIVPAGFTGSWECLVYTRKTYVIYDPSAAQ